MVRPLGLRVAEKRIQVNFRHLHALTIQLKPGAGLGMKLTKIGDIVASEAQHRGTARMEAGMFPGLDVPLGNMHTRQDRLENALEIVERIGAGVRVRPRGGTPVAGERNCQRASLVRQLTSGNTAKDSPAQLEEGNTLVRV